ncbi:MAG: hypothetical protein [Bacteriophage sp.]|nr:MAG: hypothetical protein [Bacteriophage sp.]
MATIYPQMTPPRGANGTWTVRPPFNVGANTKYTCIAIRSFADFYREGIDLQATVYTPVGLTNGVQIDNTTTFNLKTEETLGINIITLADGVGNYLLIPDNYITSFPSATAVSYSEVILSCSLGALPSDVDVSLVSSEMAAVVKSVFGVDPTINVHLQELVDTYTYEASLELEKSRRASITLNNQNQVQISALQDQITLLQGQVAALAKLAADHNLI